MRDLGNAKRFCLVAIAGLEWLALGPQIFLFIQHAVHHGQPAVEGLIDAFSFFTILTNLLVAIVTTDAFFRGKSNAFLSRPATMSATAVYIFMVGMIYSLLLRVHTFPNRMQLLTDHALHDLLPILYVFYWLFFVAKGKLRWALPIYWLAYPLLYFDFVLVRGSLTGRYPYGFISVPHLGYPRVFAVAGVFLLLFLALGVIVVAVDKKLGRAAACDEEPRS